MVGNDVSYGSNQNRRGHRDHPDPYAAPQTQESRKHWECAAPQRWLVPASTGMNMDPWAGQQRTGPTGSPCGTQCLECGHPHAQRGDNDVNARSSFRSRPGAFRELDVPGKASGQDHRNSISGNVDGSTGGMIVNPA